MTKSGRRSFQRLERLAAEIKTTIALAKQHAATDPKTAITELFVAEADCRKLGTEISELRLELETLRSRNESQP